MLGLHDVRTGLRRTADLWHPTPGSVTSLIPEVIPRIREVTSRISEVMSRISQIISRISEVTSRISEVISRVREVTSRINDVIPLISEVISRISEMVRPRTTNPSAVFAAACIIWARKRVGNLYWG